MDLAYVLHRRRYRETSLIVELLTREQGRLAAVAKGALRARSPLGAVLQPLVPLSVTARGRGELLTLHNAEPQGPALVVVGTRLYSVFYLNELIMRLTVVHDPLPMLYDVYAATLADLAGDFPLEPLLRRFERDLLEMTGLGMILDTCVDDGLPIQPALHYDYIADQGPSAGNAEIRGKRVSGATLLALAGERPWALESSAEAKQLMRYVINHHLDGRPLAAREFFTTSSAGKS